MIESMMLYNKPDMKEWNPSPDVSELYIMIKSTSNNYCSGGDFAYAINDINGLQSMETETNYPYSDHDKYKKGSTAELKIPPSSYYLGYKKVNDEYVVRIFDSTDGTDTGTFGTEQIKIIKSLLSSGIPIAAAMHGASDNMALNPGVTFTHEECGGNETIDHQVTIVGYGKKDKTDVWVVRNSWGPKWGAKGYFYVPIGSNSYCLEMYAYAIIPIEFNNENLESVGKRNRGFFKL